MEVRLQCFSSTRSPPACSLKTPLFPHFKTSLILSSDASLITQDKYLASVFFFFFYLSPRGRQTNFGHYHNKVNQTVKCCSNSSREENCWRKRNWLADLRGGKLVCNCLSYNTVPPLKYRLHLTPVSRVDLCSLVLWWESGWWAGCAHSFCWALKRTGEQKYGGEEELYFQRNITAEINLLLCFNTFAYLQLIVYSIIV